ncbi:MAG: anaerobic ribonucleoside-triphosphate reductase activating protein [Butyrivibrio sp.]|nr:anaerobic ribonucleoside-triphosphate reductase activating protein [Muribaculum sp.]MCM1553531.1 anaerobic ribonucleoside-triphosphate reductase activating protein [Butyrivibrio sp.]
MRIYGLQKTTLLDYPEHVAATIFTGGCNFRCPFCQNAGLVLMGKLTDAEGGNETGAEQMLGKVCPPVLIPEEEVFSHLRKRQGILEGLCITGGEPTLQTDLGEFIERVKGLGYAVKLDTNGYRPEVLAELLERGLLDYVAMDIKASKENYARAVGLVSRTLCCGRPELRLERIEESIRLLQGSGIPYEFRTTAVKGLHTVEEFAEIGRWLAGSRAYFIQSYEEQGEILGKVQSGTERGVLAEDFGSFAAEELKQAARLAGKYIARVELRGVTE